MEIDFLVEKPVLGRRRNISPIEVKSGRNIRHASLDKFVAKYKQLLSEPFILCDRDMRIDEGITILPLYMAPCL